MDVVSVCVQILYSGNGKEVPALVVCKSYVQKFKHHSSLEQYGAKPLTTGQDYDEIGQIREFERRMSTPQTHQERACIACRTT